MSQREINCFISCRYASEDHKIIRFIKDFMDALGFKTNIADEADIRPPEKKIRQMIEDCDCLCAIATKDSKLEGIEQWTTTPWIHSEVGMTYMLKKPLILFVEEGVNLKGLEARAASYFPFKRENLKNDAVKIVKFLSNSKDKISEEISSTPKTEEYFEINKLRVILTLENSGYWNIEREFEIISLLPQLSEIFDDTWISNSINFPFIEPNLSVFEINKNKGKKVSHEVITKTREYIQWLVNISPPLKEKEKLSYCWNLRCKGYIPLFFEEINKQIKKGEWIRNQTYAEEGITITSKTRELIFEVQFPPDYPIENCDFAVLKGYDPGARKISKEYQRIKESKNFIKNLSGRHHSLELRVENPLILHTYQLLWEPPTKEEAINALSLK